MQTKLNKIKEGHNEKIETIKKITCCLQFYVRLGLENPLDERQIMEDRLSSAIGSMPQTWPG
jgi:hypothetical protein